MKKLLVHLLTKIKQIKYQAKIGNPIVLSFDKDGNRKLSKQELQNIENAIINNEISLSQVTNSGNPPS